MEPIPQIWAQRRLVKKGRAMDRLPLVALPTLAVLLCQPTMARAGDYPQPATAPFTIQLDGPFAGGYYSNLAPGLAFDSEGNYVVAWSRSPGGGSDVVARLFTTSGRPRGPVFRVSSSTSADVFNQGAQVGMNPFGGFVVVWGSQGPAAADNGVRAQLFTAGGTPTGNEIVVAATGSDGFALSSSALAVDSTGQFVVCWGERAGVVARRFDRDGLALGPAVVASGADPFAAPVIAMPGSGDFVLSWVSASPTGGRRVVGRPYHVGRRFHRSEAGFGEEFQVNQSPLPSAGNYPAIGLMPDDTLVVTWQSCPTDIPDAACRILARRFDNGNNPRSGEFVVSEENGRRQTTPVIAVGANGESLIAWQSCPVAPNLGECEISVRPYDGQGEQDPEVIGLATLNEMQDATV